jgi:hypothetical protein
MTTFDVTDDASLRAAIFKISNDFADDGIVNGSTGATPLCTISIPERHHPREIAAK